MVYRMIPNIVPVLRTYYHAMAPRGGGAFRGKVCDALDSVRGWFIFWLLVSDGYLR